MTRFALSIALLLVALPAWSSETPSIRPLSGDQVRELMGGETIRDLQRGTPLRAEVIGLIRAPLDELAPILVDYPRIPEWAPATRDIEIVGSGDGCTYIEGVTQVPWPISNRTWRMCSRSEYSTIDGFRAFVYRFDHVPGTGNIDASFGYWVLFTLPEAPEWTYVRYVVNADPGIAIPQGILTWATGRALPDLITGLRDRHAELH
jgi:hypothetical protein